jgi:hypothetical protein
MSAKTKACLNILSSAASMQWSVADMLESKAIEMETLRDWVLHTVRSENMGDRNMFIMHSYNYHVQLIDLIHGITKMESGLAKNMELILVEEEIVPDNAFGDAGGMLFGGEEA